MITIVDCGVGDLVTVYNRVMLITDREVHALEGLSVIDAGWRQ